MAVEVRDGWTDLRALAVPRVQFSEMSSDGNVQVPCLAAPPGRGDHARRQRGREERRGWLASR